MKKEHAACAIGMELPGDHPLRQSLTDAKATFEELMDEFLICMKLNMISLLKLLCFPLRMRHWPKKTPSNQGWAWAYQPDPRLRTCTDEEVAEIGARCASAVGCSSQNVVFFWKTSIGLLARPLDDMFQLYIYIYICIYIFGICDKKTVYIDMYIHLRM